MTTTFDVEANELIKAVAKKLKTEAKLKPPEWVATAKTGPHVQRAPSDPDFWYERCASLLRRLHVKGPVGISRLQQYYGGKKKYGVGRAHFVKSGGSIIRHALQQLESAGFVTKARNGRSISKTGVSLLDNTANGLA